MWYRISVAPDQTDAPGSEQRECSFFLYMALAIAATVLVGFGAFVALGISSFSAPWWVHVHGVSYIAWIALYVQQNLAVFRGSIEQHRRLGKIGVGLAVWIVLVGLVLTPVTLAHGRVPPFFSAPFFLALDWINIVCFAGLVYAAFHFRKQTDWHRRLMLCATISVIAPAWGRLLVLADVMSEWTNFGVLLIYVIVAMIADRSIRGRVHKAYVWGFGAIFVTAPAISALSAFPPFQELATKIAG